VHNDNAQRVTSNVGEGVWETFTELGNSANIVVHDDGVSSLNTLSGEPLFGYVCSLHKQA
jgi:hypothetical protein